MGTGGGVLGGGGVGGGLVCEPGVTTQACYDGPASTEGKGECKAGAQLCNAMGTGFDPCQGQVLPAKEVCLNKLDDDCDEKTDEAVECLSNNGLVARWFIDEAASGQGPTELNDATANPLNLPLTYSADMSFDNDGGRGLDWQSPGSNGRASIAVDGTKLKTALDGANSITAEVVVDVDSVAALGSRFFNVGSGNEWRFALGAHDMSTVIFRWQASVVAGEWNVMLDSKLVLHLVIATGQNKPADRVALFVNGTKAAKTATVTKPPAKNEGLQLLTGRHLALGNRESGARSLEGDLFYVAFYKTALSNNQVHNNAAGHTNDDDSM